MPDHRYPARHELPDIDAAALGGARAADRAVAAAVSSGVDRWLGYLEPLPDHLRDDPVPQLRAAARRIRSAYGTKDSIRDTLPADVTEPILEPIDRLLKVIARHDAHR